MGLPDLTRAVANIWNGYQASKFGFVIAELHRLLPLALATTREGHDRDAVVQMAYLYQVASCVLTKVGEVDLAFICADRGEQLVQDTSDLAARIFGATNDRSYACCPTRSMTTPWRSLTRPWRPCRTCPSTPQLLSAVGTTHLVGAMVSARTHDRRAAQDHLSKAEQAAAALGADGNYSVDRVRTNQRGHPPSRRRCRTGRLSACSAPRPARRRLTDADGTTGQAPARSCPRPALPTTTARTRSPWCWKPKAAPPNRCAVTT